MSSLSSLRLISQLHVALPHPRPCPSSTPPLTVSLVGWLHCKDPSALVQSCFPFSLATEEEKCVLLFKTALAPVLGSPARPFLCSPDGVRTSAPSRESSVAFAMCTSMPWAFRRLWSSPSPARGSLYPWAVASGPALCSSPPWPRMASPRVTQWHLRCGLSKPDSVFLFSPSLPVPLPASASRALGVRPSSVTLGKRKGRKPLPSAPCTVVAVAALSLVFLKLPSGGHGLFLRMLCFPAAWKNGSDSSFCCSETFLASPPALLVLILRPSRALPSALCPQHHKRPDAWKPPEDSSNC